MGTPDITKQFYSFKNPAPSEKTGGFSSNLINNNNYNNNNEYNNNNLNKNRNSSFYSYKSNLSNNNNCINEEELFKDYFLNNSILSDTLSDHELNGFKSHYKDSAKVTKNQVLKSQRNFETEPLKILYWNVNSINDLLRKTFISKEQADVII